MRSRSDQFRRQLVQLRARYAAHGSTRFVPALRAPDSLQALLEQHAPDAATPASDRPIVRSWARFAHALLGVPLHGTCAGPPCVPVARQGVTPQARFLSRVHVELPSPSCALSDAVLPPVGLPLAAMPAFDPRSGDRPHSRLQTPCTPDLALAGHVWLAEHLSRASTPAPVPGSQRGYLRTRENSIIEPGKAALVPAATASHLVRTLHDNAALRSAAPLLPRTQRHRGRVKCLPAQSAHAPVCHDVPALEGIKTALAVAGQPACAGQARPAQAGCPGSQPYQAVASAYESLHLDTNARGATEAHRTGHDNLQATEHAVIVDHTATLAGAVGVEDSGVSVSSLAESWATGTARVHAQPDLASQALQYQVLDRRALSGLTTPHGVSATSM